LALSRILRISIALLGFSGNRVKFGELASDEWIPHAIKMKNEGKSYRQISDELSNDGFEVSKSSLQRKIG